MCRLRATLTGHTGPVRALVWGQLGDRPVLASGGEDGTVRLWDPATGAEQHALTGHDGWVGALAWGQLGDCPVLASGGEDGTVRLWDPATGAEQHALTGHDGWVGALAWGQVRDWPVLASGGEDSTVRLWDPDWEPNLRFWPPEWGEMPRIGVLTGHTGWVQALAWGQLVNGPVLASSGSVGTVLLLDPWGGEPRILPGPATGSGAVFALAWGQLEGRTLLASGGVGRFDIDRVPIDFDVSGVVSGGVDGGGATVQLWDLSDPVRDPERGVEKPRTLTGHTGWVGALAWGELGNGPVLASGDGDGTVRLWDLFGRAVPGSAARLPL